MMKLFAFILILLFVAPPAGASEVLNPVDIREWNVPDGGRSRDPFAENATSVWFVGQREHYLANLNPVTGVIKRKVLEDDPGPHNVIVGTDGVVWYTGNLEGYIGRYNPKTEHLDKIVMPEFEAEDPHTLVFDASGEHIWFTVQWGNYIGRLTVANDKVDLIPVPTSRARPYGIIVGPDGIVWVALLGTDKLASVDPATLELTEHNIASGARPRRVGATSNGLVYYSDYSRGFLGRLDPVTGKVEEWALPAREGSAPYGMAVDKHGRVWVVETGPSPNTFVGFDPSQNAITSITPIPSGAGSVRHMHYHPETDSVWFGTDENTIGRAIVDR